MTLSLKEQALLARKQFTKATPGVAASKLVVFPKGRNITMAWLRFGGPVELHGVDIHGKVVVKKAWVPNKLVDASNINGNITSKTEFRKEAREAAGVVQIRVVPVGLTDEIIAQLEKESAGQAESSEPAETETNESSESAEPDGESFEDDDEEGVSLSDLADEEL